MVVVMVLLLFVVMVVMVVYSHGCCCLLLWSLFRQFIDDIKLLFGVVMLVVMVLL